MKILCVYHKVDIDGWLSAAIVMKYYANSKDKLTLLPYNYGDAFDTVDAIKKYDRIITVDVSLDLADMTTLITHYKSNFVYIDHHAAKIDEVFAAVIKTGNGGFKYHVNVEPNAKDKKAACELTWEYYFPTIALPSVVELASAYDCFRHQSYDDNDSSVVLRFQYGLRSIMYDVDSALKILNNTINDDKLILDILLSGTSIYSYLIADAEKVYSTAFDITLTYNDVPVIFKCVNKERFNPINFGIDYHQDNIDGFACFWYDGSNWTFSLYNDNDKIDCAAIAKTFGGGGHKGASGFRTANITEFIFGFAFKMDRGAAFKVDYQMYKNANESKLNSMIKMGIGVLF